MSHDAPPASPLTPDTVLRRTEGVIEAEVNGQTVMLDLDANSYFGLNEVGSHLWAALAEPHSVRDLATALPRHFQVEAAEAEEATLAFLETLLERGLATRVGG